MSIDEHPQQEKIPAEILEGLGFRPINENDDIHPTAPPMTFDLIVGPVSTSVIARDKGGHPWGKEGIDADRMEQILLGLGFAHAASLSDPDTPNTVH